MFILSDFPKNSGNWRQRVRTPTTKINNIKISVKSLKTISMNLFNLSKNETNTNYYCISYIPLRAIQQKSIKVLISTPSNTWSKLFTFNDNVLDEKDHEICLFCSLPLICLDTTTSEFCRQKLQCLSVFAIKKELSFIQNTLSYAGVSPELINYHDNYFVSIDDITHVIDTVTSLPNTSQAWTCLTTYMLYMF